MKDIKKLSEEEKEQLIAKYTYFCSSWEDFVEEHLEDYIEMEDILDYIAKSIKSMQDKYKINYCKNECSLSLENKKTKRYYSINIEF